MKKKINFILLGIFFIAFLLRVLYLPRLALTFGYDQARDAFVSQEILDGDLKILGPPASTPGLYHGVFYYYLLAPAYWIGGGSPIVAAYWIALLNSLTVFIIYYLAFTLTKKKSVAIVSTFYFALSFEASQYAVWLSNPTLGVWTVPLVYLGLWSWIKEKKAWAPIVTGIGLGLSIQAEIFLLYHAVPLILWLWVSRKKINLTELSKFIATLVISLSTMFLVEIKFGFQSIKGIVNLLSSQDTIVRSRGFGDYIILFLNQMGKMFSLSLFPLNIGYGGFLGLFIILYVLYIWKQKKKNILSAEIFLLSYVFSHLTVVSVGGVSTPFLMVGIGSGTVILASVVLAELWKKNRNLAVIIFLGITFSNLFKIINENKFGQTIFAIQRDMLLSNELKAIDYTYEKAAGQNFSINTLTSPLWINSVWAYLYNWYGNSKFGYLPEWHGRDQIGRPGERILKPLEKETSIYYLISEPTQGIPQKFVDDTKAEEKAKYAIIEEKNYGQIIIYKEGKY
jgi:4-amino-4-deoxy-L-arabinose transferase-like glycosyltransferase